MSFLEHVKFVPGNSNAFRLIRILKLSRSSRTVYLLRYLPSVYPLQFMILSCKNSLPALCWACVLVASLLCLMSALLLDGVADFVDQITETSDVAELLRRHFASAQVCSLTLFVSVIGEADYREVIDVLMTVDPMLGTIFVGFVGFSIFAMTNVIAGIFISEAVEMASQDRGIRHHSEQARAKRNLEVLSNLFHEMDPDGTGQVSKSEFEKHLQRTEVQSLLSHFEFDFLDSAALFKLLDIDGNGYVDIEEWVVGCLRIRWQSPTCGAHSDTVSFGWCGWCRIQVT